MELLPPALTRQRGHDARLSITRQQKKLPDADIFSWKTALAGAAHHRRVPPDDGERRNGRSLKLDGRAGGV